eukprot:15332648-Ditylum_brightwellii.AAC.1
MEYHATGCATDNSIGMGGAIVEEWGQQGRHNTITCQSPVGCDVYVSEAQMSFMNISWIF